MILTIFSRILRCGHFLANIIVNPQSLSHDMWIYDVSWDVDILLSALFFSQSLNPNYKINFFYTENWESFIISDRICDRFLKIVNKIFFTDFKFFDWKLRPIYSQSQFLTVNLIFWPTTVGISVTINWPLLHKAHFFFVTEELVGNSVGIVFRPNFISHKSITNVIFDRCFPSKGRSEASPRQNFGHKFIRPI